jgi:short-subunit dehydrogenase
MRPKLKPVEEQVIVITGASSGIGLATARAAAKRGARVVLTSRNEEDLTRIAEEIEKEGGHAIAVGADVADPRAVDRVRDAAIAKFGGFDTWVNNAGISIYGKLNEIDHAESRRLFDVDFWGVVHGCRSALSHLSERGGAIINIGSVLSDRSIPLQGMYAASKHAVKGYTDALRMEVEMDNLPVSISLVKPAAIDTPYTQHARNHLDVAPRNPPPVYAPELVSDVILYCAENPKRDVIVGGGGKMFTLLEKIAPRLTDRVMEKTMDRAQKSDRPPRLEDSLFLAPLFEGETRGDHDGHVMRHSLYTTLALHPLAGAAAALGVLLAVTGITLARAR